MREACTTLNWVLRPRESLHIDAASRFARADGRARSRGTLAEAGGSVGVESEGE